MFVFYKNLLIPLAKMFNKIVIVRLFVIIVIIDVNLGKSLAADI